MNYERIATCYPTKQILLHSIALLLEYTAKDVYLNDFLKHICVITVGMFRRYL